MTDRTVMAAVVAALLFSACGGGDVPPTFSEGIEAAHFFPGLADDLLAGKTPDLRLGLTHLAARAWLGPPSRTRFVKDPRSLAAIDPEARSGHAGIPFAVDEYRFDDKSLRIVYGIVDLSAIEVGDTVVIAPGGSPTEANRRTMKVKEVKPFAGHLRVHLEAPANPPAQPVSIKPVRYRVLRNDRVILCGFDGTWVFSPTSGRNFLKAGTIGVGRHRPILRIILDGKDHERLEIHERTDP